MSAFQTLFNYISSDNKENQKISMTSPVIQENGLGSNKMEFLVSEKFTKYVPEPNDPNLKVKRFDEGLFGVIQYSALWRIGILVSTGVEC